MAIEKTIIVNVETDEAVREIDNVNKALEDTQEITKDVGENALSGAKDFKVMGVSINGVSKTLKVLKASIVATGIGALLLLVTGLATAFFNTAEGSEQWLKILRPIEQVLDGIWGVMENMGGGLWKIVTGDVVDGFEQMTTAASGFSDAIIKGLEAGRKLAELEIFQKYFDRGAQLSQALLEQIISENRLIAEDVTKTTEERLAALAKVDQAQQNSIRLNKEQLDLERKRILLGAEGRDLRDDEIDQLAQLQIAEIQHINRITEQQKELQNQRNAIKATIQEDIDVGDAVNPVTGLSTNQLIELGDLQKGVMTASGEDIIKHNKDVNDEIVANSELTRLAKAEIAKIEKEQLLNAAQDLLFGIELIAGEGTALAKAAGIANVLIDTYRAVIGTWAGYSSMGPYGTAAAIVQTVAIAAMSAAAIKKILSVQKPTKNGASGSSVSVGTQPAVPQFNIVGDNQTTQLNEQLAAQNTQPVKAYVVGKDVTTSQEMDRNTVRTAGI